MENEIISQLKFPISSACLFRHLTNKCGYMTRNAFNRLMTKNHVVIQSKFSFDEEGQNYISKSPHKCFILRGEEKIPTEFGDISLEECEMNFQTYRRVKRETTRKELLKKINQYEIIDKSNPLKLNELHDEEISYALRNIENYEGILTDSIVHNKSYIIVTEEGKSCIYNNFYFDPKGLRPDIKIVEMVKSLYETVEFDETRIITIGSLFDAQFCIAFIKFMSIPSRSSFDNKYLKFLALFKPRATFENELVLYNLL